jgi:RimJ/RimL family protein N-acetyltransferase
VPDDRVTERLRLVPVALEHVRDLLAIHQDPAVAESWGGAWTVDEARVYAERFAEDWRTLGIGKWMAYHRTTGDLVGRGGVSRAYVVDGDWHLEVGWALRHSYWGHGYATEIGAAGLAFAFDELGADEVVAYTEPGNARSRAVMERLGMVEPREIVHQDVPFVLLYRIRRVQRS